MISACLEAIASRVGEMTATFARQGGRLLCSLFRKHGEFGFARVDTGFGATATRKGGMRATFGIVCSVGLGDYILWARDGIVFNVYGDRIYLTKKDNNG